jgi:IS4 transposase
MGVRISNEKDRSGRTVTRAGMGTPVLMCAVRALNSFAGMSTAVWDRSDRTHTLQKSMLLTPLLPSAGPTGGLGLA